MVSVLNSRIPRAKVLKAVSEFQNDPALKEWAASKKSTKTRATQANLAEFIIFAGYGTPEQLLKIREEELAGKRERNGIRKKLREYRDSYIMRICKGCDTLLEKPAEFGKVATCENCGDKTLAPKSRTNALANVDSFFTNNIGMAGKVLTKGELNKESDDVINIKYAVSIDTIDSMARVADTEQRAFLFWEIQTGQDPTDTNNIILTVQDMEVFNDKTKDVWIFSAQTRRKETGRGGRPYLSGMCGEGLDAYRAYVQKKGLKAGDPVFIGKNRNPLDSQSMNLYLKAMKQKAAIDTGDLVLNLKALRSYAFSTLSSVAVPGEIPCQGSDFGKFVTGKSVPASIHTYLIANREAIAKGYRSVMAKLNPNMAKFQETLSLKDRVEKLEKYLLKQAGQLENLQNQILAVTNGKNGLAAQFAKEMGAE